ncbi:MAG: hypothetical protein WC273_02880 [Dehalococcoidia bacterium]
MNAPAVTGVDGDGVLAAPPALGPSRIVWVFRVEGPIPMAIGRLFVIGEPGSPDHLLQPRRRLAPGRYDLMFARYGVRWPVTLARIENGVHPDDMLVTGRVPL